MNFVFGTIMADVVVRANDRAARANLLHLTGDPRDFDPISDRDWSFGENDQPADEIARDVLQPEPDAYADRACENRQRAQVNAGIFKNNQNADDQHDVADDLGDGVLKGAIQSALSEESIKKKSFRPRGDPKNGNQQRDKQKNLEKAERNGWQRRVPGQRNSGGVDRGDCEKDERGET